MKQKNILIQLISRPIVQLFLLLFLLVGVYCLYENRSKITFLSTYCKEYVEITKEPQKFFYLLDAGHSRYGDYELNCNENAVRDSSNMCFYEWAFNWAVRDKIGELLEGTGIKFDFVNTSDKFMSLQERIDKINNYVAPDSLPIILISIHANYSNNKDASGFEVYIAKKAKRKNENIYKNKYDFSKIVANVLINNYRVYFPEHTIRPGLTQNVFHKEKNFMLIDDVNVYAILTENEFYSNPKMIEEMKTADFQEKIATVHFKTILELEHQFFRTIKQNEKQNENKILPNPVPNG